jgi:hypothetical protein
MKRGLRRAPPQRRKEDSQQSEGSARARTSLKLYRGGSKAGREPTTCYFVSFVVNSSTTKDTKLHEGNTTNSGLVSCEFG